MAKCKCKWTQQLLWLKDTHIQVSVQIHTTGRRNACGPRQRWRYQHPWRRKRPWMVYNQLLLLLMSDLQISSNTNLWEETSNILGVLLSVLDSFMPEHCYKIIFLNQLFSLSWRACEVHGTCKQSYTQGPSMSNQDCILVFETALQWVSAHTYHNLVRKR